MFGISEKCVVIMPNSNQLWFISITKYTYKNRYFLSEK